MEDTTHSAFGDLLKALRKHCNITQHELAVRLGVHRNTIGSWERGDFLPESKTIVLELAHQLHLDASHTRSLLEASLTALPSYWYVPYQRNPFFTGREGVLCQLHDVLTHKSTATLSQSYVLSGLGGIGKTQTAIEYAYRYANDYAAVFWISAETGESIVSSFVTIANLLNLPEKQAQEQSHVVAAVTRWLANHSDWLLIFDNVEDISLVKGVLPAARCGFLLFTSRRQDLGFTTRALDLEPLTPEEGVHFLLYRTRLLDPASSLDHLASTDVAFAQEIVAEMDGLPLALDQAGAYIEMARCGLFDYLQLFRGSQLHLLGEREAPADHPLSVARTFALAFERLEQSNSSATELLTVCAFLAPDAIPEIVFSEGAAHLGAAFEALAADPLQFNAAIKALLLYSLLQRHAVTRTVTIHRLVQVVLKESLSEEMQRLWATRVIRVMTQLFPAGEHGQADYWPVCEKLLPHALACVALGEQWDENVAERTALMSHVATYLSYRSRYVEAKSLYDQALCLGESTLGTEHPLVAEVLCGLARFYRVQVRYEESALLLQRALSIRERTLGTEHPLISEIFQNQAILSIKQGKYEEAELLFQRALGIRERTLGADHPLVASSLNNLGSVYAEQGKYEEAELPFQRALGIRERTLGADHPLVASSLNNLGYFYYIQGKYEEAELMLQRALSIWERVLGTEDPDVTYPLTNLGTLYTKLGRYEEAEAHLQRALQLRKQVLGPQHPEVAETLHRFALLHQAQQHTSEALLLYQQALAIREQVLGVQHPKTREIRAAYTQLLREIECVQKAIAVETRITEEKIETSEVLKEAAFLVEQSREALPVCPTCQRNCAVIRSGVNRTGTCRFRCRACQHYFTPEANKCGYDASIKAQALALAGTGMSCRAIAQSLKVHYSTISLWIKGSQRQQGRESNKTNYRV